MISIKNIYAAAWKTTQGMIHLMSETSDEEVNFGSFDIDAIPHTDSDHAWANFLFVNNGKFFVFFNLII